MFKVPQSLLNLITPTAGDNSKKAATTEFVQQAVSAITIPNATEATAGIAKVATQVLTDAGVNDVTFITPLKLKNSKTLRASEARSFGVTYTASTDGFFIANSCNGGAVYGGFTMTVAGGVVVYSRSPSEGASGYQTGIYPIRAGQSYSATLQGAGAYSLGAFFVPFI